jgi:gluconolactonase
MNRKSFSSPLLPFVAAALLCAVSTTGSAVKELDVVAPGAEVKQLATGFSFTEGPAADKSGDVYFSDIPNTNINKYDFKTGEGTNPAAPTACISIAMAT